jgi:hypothetical protein
VARVANAKEWFALLDRLEAMGIASRQAERSSADPLVAVWVSSPTENPEPLALVADLILLGGGWKLLEETLLELNRARGLAREVRLERLATVGGVYVPAFYDVEHSEQGSLVRVVPRPGVASPNGLPGAAPFLAESSPPPPGHPEPEVQHLLGGVESPEGLAQRLADPDRVRLHFFLGLPGGSGDAIAGWVKRFRHACLRRLKDERRLPRIGVSLACFVPRPWTPLQWWPMATERALKAEIARVMRGLGGIRDLTVTHDLPKWALLEGCLSRGDRRTGWLLLAVRRFGWDRALVQSPLNPAFILHRPRTSDETLPWDHLVWGIDRARLRAQYESLLSALGEHA